MLKLARSPLAIAHTSFKMVLVCLLALVVVAGQCGSSSLVGPSRHTPPPTTMASSLGPMAAGPHPAGPVSAPRQARKFSGRQAHDHDPMEACYLANNRASETLTISESTPVGTVVGEIMVSVNVRPPVPADR
jgi:hypothetical protein